jgi:hypothetical protein
MNAFERAVIGLSLCFAFAGGLAAGCEKKAARSPGSDGDGTNLCTEYKTCNDCIAGLKAGGDTEGEAETQCGAAVLGCWTTWDKPIKCGGKQYDEKPSS